MRLTKEVMLLVDKLIVLYNTPEGITGSYGHVVFDDSNFAFAEVCLKDAKEDDRNEESETLKACIEALEQACKMDEHDIEQAYNFFWNIVNRQWDIKLILKYNENST